MNGRLPVVALCAALVMSTLSACASSGPAGRGSSGGGSRTEDRVILGSFAEIEAVAVTRRFVFAATPSGIAVLDRSFGRWLPPLTSLGPGGREQITAIAADPIEDALWFGVPGGLVIFRPDLYSVQRAIVVGIPDLIAFDRSGNGNVYVRASGQWSLVTRTGMSTLLNGPPPGGNLILPTRLDDIYRRYPALQGQLGFLMRDNAPNRPMRTPTPISGALAPDRTSETWIGTAGDGLWRVDAAFYQATPFRFGPHEVGIGAIAPFADGIWAAGLGQSNVRGGLTYASNDLQQWEWIQGTIAVPLIGVTSRALNVRGQRAWIGTDRGLVRVLLDQSREIRAWTSLDGLPGDRVYAVAARNNGAWVGTDRGLAWVNDTVTAQERQPRGVTRTLLENMPVYALQSIGDTLWIGTESGLLALPGSEADLARPVSEDPALRRRVRALAWSDTILLVATDDALLHLAPRGGRAPARVDIDVRAVGQVTRIAIDPRTMLVAGTDGVLVLQRADGLLRQMRVGLDLPGPALDVVISEDWFWVATPMGLVRIRRAGNGGLP